MEDENTQENETKVEIQENESNEKINNDTEGEIREEEKKEENEEKVENKTKLEPSKTLPVLNRERSVGRNTTYSWMLVMEDEESMDENEEKSEEKEEDKNLVEVHDLSTIYESTSEMTVKEKHEKFKNILTMDEDDSFEESEFIQCNKGFEEARDENIVEVHDLSTIYESSEFDEKFIDPKVVRNANRNNYNHANSQQQKKNSSNQANLSFFSDWKTKVVGAAVFVVGVGYYFLKKKN